ncbi:MULTISPECIES: tyrosine-type recombinase/integrase [Robinsoniella]|uniref:tyrosine-type recombinase/integrase n=1 Tax=Robinsoniella TaxID=588605 RepID=UPI000486906D|nr:MULTISPECIES: site-specific integrase [Robinsoniella]
MVKSNNELLQYAISNGIINFEDVQKKIDMAKREQILRKHPFEIWESENGYCYTYLPDETKKNGRRQIKRKLSKGKNPDQAIEDAIVEFYQKQESDEKKRNTATLKTVFQQWMEYKCFHTNSSSYMKRISNDWFRFFEPENISVMPIKDLDVLFLDNWCHKTIKKFSLTSKQFYNMAIILRQGLDYAVRTGVISENPFLEVVINRKMLRKTEKKADETQVFSIKEEPQIIAFEKERFNENGFTVHLGIILAFKIGLRVGELSALSITDFNEDLSYVHVHAMEVLEYDTDDNISYHVKERKVVDYTKSCAGDRTVYVPQDARKLVKQIIKTNISNGIWEKGYLFIRDNGERIQSHSFSTALLRCCKKLNLTNRSMHKIRKTYISALIDGNININEIRKQVGHEDERTTLRNYCFNRYTRNQTEEQMENALKLKA